MFDQFDPWGVDALEDSLFGRESGKGMRAAATRLCTVEIGRNVCFGGKGGGSSAPPPPDPAVGQAAQGNVELGKEWLAFSKEQYAAGQVRQDATDALIGQVVDQQIQTQDEANTWGREDRARTLETYQPLEDEFVKTANEFDTPEKQSAAAAAAKADVLGAAAQQQQSQSRQMASMGISPTSGRFAGITRANDVNTALASAGAQNNARTMIRDKGIALRGDAINMGKGLASSAAAAYGIGNNSGNSAVSNNQSGNQNFYQNGNVMSQGFNGNIGANNSAGSMLGNLYGTQVGAWNSQQQAKASGAAGMGQLAGTGLMAYATYAGMAA